VFNDYAGPFVIPGDNITISIAAANANTFTGGIIVDAQNPGIDVDIDAAASDATVPLMVVQYDIDVVMDAAGSLSATAPPFVTNSPEPSLQLTTIYKCTLEAAGDPTDFVTLPIQSFQTRQQDSDPSWLQVVVPNFIEYEFEITARIDGVLRVYQGTRDQFGNEIYNPLAWGDVDQYQFQVGGNRSSAIIGSHGNEVTTSPKVWPLINISYRASLTGIRNVRGTPDQNLRPGDTVTYDGESFVVGRIQYAISPTAAQMNVFEVAA